MNENSVLEVALVKIMIALIVRYPDGLERIHARFQDVVLAGEELCGEDGPDHTL